MVDKIRILSENLIRKIAAGEVIERPASVVKELVENSLDAQANRVHVEMREGGRQAMVVADDGVGMSRADAELCVARHTTSKLSSPSDLFAIATLGFRGEALASIGAVSRLTIDTCAEADEEGTRVVVEGGIQRELMAVARARGTTVAVRNLFFNTPARRKFLRHVETEARYTTQVMLQLAAAHPQVGFTLVHQDRTIFELASSDRRGRAGEALGLDAGSLILVQTTQEGLALEAFVCPPAECRGSRSRQFLVVRSRPITSRSLSQAVYRGYGGLLPSGSHPSFVVWLDLDPRQVDVNVHPTKREVRFAEEGRICELLEAAVRQALDIPTVAAFTYRKGGVGIHSEQVRETRPDFAFGAAVLFSRDNSAPGEMPAEQIPLSLQMAPITSSMEKQFTSGPTAERAELQLLLNVPAIWQLHNKYLLIPTEEGLVIVDQHVAHERVRYEEALDRLKSETTASQQLLFPMTLKMNTVEFEVVREAQTLFEKLGFGIREFGTDTFVVDSIPAEMKGWGEGGVFYRILEGLIEEKNNPGTGIHEALAASYACHTSIRAGDELAHSERQALLNRLAGAREPYVCPHGRPIIVKVTLNELDRLFGRT